MKEEILNTAEDLFLNLGFKSVTMDDIARDMGISKKTIYSHYAHKTELVHDVSFHLMEQILAGVNAIIAEDLDPIVELYEIKKYVLQHFKGEKSSPSQQLQKYYAKIYEAIKDRQFRFMQQCVQSNFNRGIAQGLFRDNLNINFVSRIYFLGITGIKDHTVFPVDEFLAVDLYEQYLEYHLRGIVTPKGREILLELINANHNS